MLWAACLLFAVCISACSIPTLESAQCSAAREGVRKFYSFHLGNDMQPSAENIELRKRFLTTDLYDSLRNGPFGEIDPFTNSQQPPRTFKIGKCVEMSDNTSKVQVQLYWKDDAATTQKELHVEAVKEGDAWLINKLLY